MFRPKYKPLENGLVIKDIEFIADRWCCFFPDIFESKDRALAHIKGILNSEIQVVPRRQEKVFSRSGNSKFKYTEAHIKAESINKYEEENFLKECIDKEYAEDNAYSECDRDDYPPELEIAFNAWRAVAIHGQGEGSTPKKRLINWLETHYKDLKNGEVERIATVCNWKKEPGRK